jgi:hypothetical protein
VGEFTSLALDAAGHPHISYYDKGNGDGDLKYAHWTGSAWDIQTVDRVGNVGWYTSLALDGDGHPHISYYDHANGDLKYAHGTGSTWDLQTVDHQDNRGLYSSLALDAADHPHISYFDSTNLDLKYAHWTGSTWDIETVDSEGWVGSFASLAMDTTDHPHISYYDYSNYDLKYARKLPPPLVLDKEAMPWDGLHIGDTLTYTLTLSGSGVSARLWDPLPTTVQYITDSITSTLSPPTIYSYTVHAIVWKGTLPTSTVSIARFQVTPRISATGVLSLSPAIVNTAWLTDTGYGRSVSATVIVNGSRVYLPQTMRQVP